VNREQRLIFAPALRQMADEARRLRAQLAPDDPARHFLLGVDAAVQTLLHPEAADARHPSWLDHETDAFREGYLATMADVTAAVSRGTPPIRMALPQPPPAVGSRGARSP
jgi:hypothetical protein